jgi:hypothetical protein
MHMALPYYSVPSYIGSQTPNVTDDMLIDIVFLKFLEKTILGILNGIQSEKSYTTADVSPYSTTLTNAVLGQYAQAMWN